MGVVVAAVLLPNLAAAKLDAKANQTHADKAVASAGVSANPIKSHMTKVPGRQLDQVAVARGVEIMQVSESIAGCLSSCPVR